MIITGVRTHVLEARLSQPFAYSRAWYDTRTAMVVEIETDAGLIGWGECYGPARMTAAVVQSVETADSLAEAFPLLRAIEPQGDHAIHRFSVTQLINYQRCPRQYYFDRVLHAPAPDAIAVWNDAEAPEPPARRCC